MIRFRSGRSWLALALMAAPAAAGVQEAPGEVLEAPEYWTFSILEGRIGGDAAGAIGINMAAGDGNLQANTGALAIGDYAAAVTDTVQIVGPGAFTLPDRSESVIQGRAFQGARGWVGVNQASGVGNAQSNRVSVAVGGGSMELTTDSLAQVVASPTDQEALAEGEAGSRRTAEIGPDTFRGAGGVIQINQSAGSFNATSNSFALRVNDPQR